MVRRFAVLAVMTVVALAACGGGGTNKTSVSLGAASSGTAAASSSGSSGGSSSGGQKFCTDPAANNLAQTVGATASAGSGADTATLQRELSALRQYEADAPSAIKGDVTTLVNFYAKYVQIFIKRPQRPDQAGHRRGGHPTATGRPGHSGAARLRLLRRQLPRLTGTD